MSDYVERQEEQRAANRDCKLCKAARDGGGLGPAHLKSVECTSSEPHHCSCGSCW